MLWAGKSYRRAVWAATVYPIETILERRKESCPFRRVPPAAAHFQFADQDFFHRHTGDAVAMFAQRRLDIPYDLLGRKNICYVAVDVAH